jgi:3D (Asp-Asp-Asp) domain-containing protein
MPSTPPPTTSPHRSAADSPEDRTSRKVVAARLGVVLAAAAGTAGLTVATAGAAGPAAAARPAGSRSDSAGVGAQVHAEAVSAPVLVTAAELAQAEHAEEASAAPAPAPAPPAAAAATAAPAAPATVRSASASSSPGGTDLGTFMVTCYDIHGRTASGEEAGPQSVAVDPSVIPLGTEIYIDGVGYRRADDTGGGVRGRHIDIWESSYSACAAFGRQYRDVHRVS